MMVSLPNFTDVEAYRAWRSNAALWLPAARDISRVHRIAASEITVFATGTNLVVGLDAHLILKIFPPMLRSQFTSERAALSRLAGRLDVPIPEIVAEGERDGWPYLVITRLDGTLGSQAWPTLPEDQKERVLGQLGQTVADVQRVPPGALRDIEPSWDVFMRQQLAQCRARHERLGLPAKFVDGLDDLLSDAAALVPMDAPPVILTGEYIPENLLLAEQAGVWRLAGLIDFGDVMTGWGEYDLLGPSAFMAAGRPRRVRSLFEGFGYPPAQWDASTRRRLMALMFLHRVSDPMRHICIDRWWERVEDLTRLSHLVWPT